MRHSLDSAMQKKSTRNSNSSGVCRSKTEDSNWASLAESTIFAVCALSKGYFIEIWVIFPFFFLALCFVAAINFLKKKYLWNYIWARKTHFELGTKFELKRRKQKKTRLQKCTTWPFMSVSPRLSISNLNEFNIIIISGGVDVHTHEEWLIICERAWKTFWDD